MLALPTVVEPALRATPPAPLTVIGALMAMAFAASSVSVLFDQVNGDAMVMSPLDCIETPLKLSWFCR